MKLKDKIYLKLSDCDGICEACNGELRRLCEKRKNQKS